MLKVRRDRIFFLALPLIALLMHYPRFFFLFDKTDTLLHSQLWDNEMKLLCNWDCPYYVERAHSFPFGMGAFFPLFPLLLKIFMAMVPILNANQATIALTNLLSVAAVSAFVVLGKSLWKGRPYAAWAFGLAVAIFPFSQFHSYGYSEPLFLILFCGMIYFVAKNAYLPAAVIAGLCAISRPQGIWVMGIFLGLFLYYVAFKLKKLNYRHIPVVLLATIPLIVFMIWNQIETGDFLHFIKLQSKWGREFDLFGGLANHLPRFEINHIFLYLSLFAGFRFFKRKEMHWKILGLTSILMAEVPLFIGGYSYSYSRFIASNVGFFALLVELVEARPWLATGFILWAVTRLDAEVYKWLTGIGYHGIGP